jgi:hypothetical protein
MPPESIPEFVDLSTEEITQFVPRLVSEVDTHPRSDRWVLMPRGRGAARLHTSAALWQACELLQDVVAMIANEREMALRILNRSLLEACLVGFYLHLGGLDALHALESDMKATLVTQQRDVSQYDAELRRELKSVRKHNKTVRRDNEARAGWNRTRNNDTQRLPMLERTPEPTRPAVNLDLSSQLASFAGHTATSLKLPTVVHRINELAKAKYPREQNFGVVYTIGFRTLSSIRTSPEFACTSVVL